MDSIAAKRGAGEPNGYRVEVSGWDAEEKFFVEKSMLIWLENVGKRLALNAKIRIGSVLFVRLMQPLGGGTSFPVAYRAVDFEIGAPGSRGMVTLQQLQPRMAFQETAPHFSQPSLVIV